MQAGLIKWFDADKGFGVIGTPEGEEVFLHINSFPVRPEKVGKGTVVFFETRIDAHRNRLNAKNSRIASMTSDWERVMQYLGALDFIQVEREKTARERAGHIYRRKIDVGYSITKRAAAQIAEGKTENELYQVIVDYFNGGLERSNFVPYCQAVESCIQKHFANDLADRLLKDIFEYFAESMDEVMLFQVWQEQKFRFIGREEDRDYAIPETILQKNISGLGIAELTRISNYNFGPAFVQAAAIRKLQSIEPSVDTLRTLYSYLDFVELPLRASLREYLDKKQLASLQSTLDKAASELPPVTSEATYAAYERLRELIPAYVSDSVKQELKQQIAAVTLANCEPGYRCILWLKGMVESPGLQDIGAYFHLPSTGGEKRMQMLAKLLPEEKVAIMKGHAERTGAESGLNLLAQYVLYSENRYGSSTEVLQHLYDDSYWEEKPAKSLVYEVRDYINASIHGAERLPLFLKGLLPDAPKEAILEKAGSLTKNELERIAQLLFDDQSGLLHLLNRELALCEKSSRGWVCELAMELLNAASFEEFDRVAFAALADEDYFELWETGKLFLLPIKHINSLLADDFSAYSRADNWVRSGRLTSNQLADLLLQNVADMSEITDRKIFARQQAYIRYLLKLDAAYKQAIIEKGTEFHRVILWAQDQERLVDFTVFKSKFIYFSPEEQVRLLRKLFHMIATGLANWTIEELAELTRFDWDLYQLNKEHNPDLPVDISTDVVLKSLLSYKQTGKFLMEGELLKIVLYDLKEEKKRRFQLEHYFEACAGRMSADYDWDTEGQQVVKKYYGAGQFYFAIYFSNDRLPRNANSILPPGRWNDNERHWGVEQKYEAEVLEYARRNRFLIDLGPAIRTNNKHLAVFKRIARPKGVQYCEGRPANNKDAFFDKEFWWCTGNQPCYMHCETIHPPEQWEQYTLLDFCKILGFNVDDRSIVGDHVPNGHYYMFVSRINRFNRLLERLYCQHCEEVLYPSDVSHFAAYAVVRFQCINEKCSHHRVVYLNHCLNGKCNHVIDSRISRSCEHGLYICDNCGACCSHEMLKRRLSNLRLTGGYIHEQLVYCVDNKLGHLERAEYFCYRDGQIMEENPLDVFSCATCDVKYDTRPFHLKRPHRELVNRNLDADNLASTNPEPDGDDLLP